MKLRLTAVIFGLVATANAYAISQEKLMYLCSDVLELDATLAMQSLQPEGSFDPQYKTLLQRFRLTDEQVAPVIERYKKRPGDARLIAQYPPHADRYYLENCMADPVRYIPNYEKLKSVYK